MMVIVIKRLKEQKLCNKKRTKFKNYKYCNKANQLDNIMKYLEENWVNTDVLKKNYVEFIKNNNLISKTRQ